MSASRPTVVVTHGADGPLVDALAELGADAWPLPAIRIEPPADPSPLDDAIARRGRFQWLVLTSKNAAEAVASRPGFAAFAADELPRLRVATVGRATAARAADLGMESAIVAADAGAEGLLAALASATPSLDGAAVLWPRSDVARRELPDGLRAAGAAVVNPVAYRTVPADWSGDGADRIAAFREGLSARRFDAITFLSPSAALGLAAGMSSGSLDLLPGRIVVGSIGATTSDTLRELGAPPDVESPERRADDLARTLVHHLRRKDPAS